MELYENVVCSWNMSEIPIFPITRMASKLKRICGILGKHRISMKHFINSKFVE